MSVQTFRFQAGKMWETREAKCLSIIERGLSLLRQREHLPESEVELNRHLYFCLLTASRELYPDDEIAPVTECNNQPDPDDQTRARREQKRPDFQWIYLDRYEPDAERSSKQFVVECKRIGTAPRADWILNANYIDHGIARFREPEWAYGKRASSGAMVGYWQSTEAEAILKEVNYGCRTGSFPDLVLLGAWRATATSRLEQVLIRSFELSPFKLHHLWIDLRP